MTRPYRFTQEQQARLDAHFGGREAWLPMTLDELVAALVEAQAVEVAGEAKGEKAGFTKDTSCTKLRLVVRTGNTAKEEGMTASSASKKSVDLSALSAQLLEEVKKAFPGVQLTQKQAYIRAHIGEGRGLTVGYLYPSPSGGKSAVEIIRPDGSGKYTYTAIASAGDLRKAIAAMKAVEKKATAAASKKKPATAKPATAAKKAS